MAGVEGEAVAIQKTNEEVLEEKVAQKTEASNIRRQTNEREKSQEKMEGNNRYRPEPAKQLEPYI